MTLDVPYEVQFLIGQARHDRSGRVQLQLAQHPATPPEVLSELARSERWNVRGDVALHHNTPLEVLRQLATDPDADVRGRCAQHPDLPAEVLLTLAGDRQEKVRAAAVAHPAFPTAALAALGLDPSHLVRVAVARHPALPGPVREALVRDSHAAVRLALARRDDLGLDLQLHLAGDLLGDVRRAIAERQDLDRQVIAALLRAGGHGVLEALRERLGDHARDDEQYAVRMLKRKALTEDSARALAQSEHASVRALVARHEVTPVETLLALLEDPVAEVRLAAFEALEFEPEDLLRFAADPSEELRSAAARLRRAPLALLLRLATDPSLQVRLAVYQDRRVRPELLPPLLEERDPDVLRAALGTRGLPAEVLRHMSDLGVLEPQDAATQRHTPEDLLLTLADHDLAAARIVAGSLGLTGEVAERLYAWNDVEVMRGLAENPRTPLEMHLGLLRHPDDDVAFAAFAHFRAALKSRRGSAQVGPG